MSGPPLLAAEAYLAAMTDFGVDALYAVAGTDFPSIAEAYARAPARGATLPMARVCPHENLAVAMAHGHSLATGRPQAAMVHVSVGTSNMICMALNALRDQVPILLSAGRTPVSEDPDVPGSRSRFIHWAQEMRDQAGQLREAVKWDYELRRGDQAEAALARALEVAMAPPPGPVYLSLPREALAEEVAPDRPRRRPTPVAPPAPDAGAVDRLADALARAELPLLITSNTGREPAAVETLARLAETWAIPVVTFNPRSVCLPFDHPMHLGVEPGELLRAADLILTVACDVPWVPRTGAPDPEVPHYQVGLDPLYATYPMRSFPSTEALTAAPGAVLAALAQALGAPKETARIDARRARMTELRKRRQAALDSAAQGPGLTAASASRALAQHLPDSATVVNEYSFQVPQGRFTRPGSFHGLSPAGGLGWGFGAALGMAAGGASAPVVAMLGDGAYLFNNPSACHWASAAHGLPVLTVIFNNRRWGAVRNSTLAMYPQGAAAQDDGMFLADLSPSVDHAALARAHGAEAWDVRTLEEVPRALDAALAAVAGGTQAMLVLHLED